MEVSHCLRIVVHAVFPQRGDLEKKIHEQLAGFQVAGFRGKEWFAAPLTAIVAVVAGHL